MTRRTEISDKPYTNRELDIYRSEVIMRLDRIEAQTTKTNGRVTSLEQKLVDTNTAAKVFRARVTTAIALLSFLLGSILIPLAAAYISAGRL